MNNFVENIRQIGFFMIAAQAVIHLAPGKQYEKYVKLIAGVMILLQFVSPFLKQSEEIFVKWKNEIAQIEENMRRHGQDGFLAEAESAGGTPYGYVLDNIEEEVKQRFNGLDSCDGYQVLDVKIELGEKKGVQQTVWEFENVQVVMRRAAGTGREERQTEDADEVNAGEMQETEIEDADKENVDVNIGKIVVENIETGNSPEKEQRRKEGGSTAEGEMEGAGNGSLADSGTSQIENEFARIFGEELGIDESLVEVRIYGGN